MLCPVNSDPNLLGLLAPSSQLRDTAVFYGFSFPAPHPGNCLQATAGLTLCVSHISGTTVLHGMMSNVLKTARSYMFLHVA